eukprot:g127.t1
MLAIPLKSTCRVDLSKPIHSFVEREFSDSEGGENVAANLRRFQDLRNGATSRRSASAETRTAIETYYTQLRFAQSRFPVSDTQIKLAFTWFDAFQPKQKVALCSFAYEQASVLFNAAAQESHMGVLCDRTAPDGVEAAAKHFTRSAQLFNLVRTRHMGELQHVRGMTMDLSNEGLEMLVAILSAQSQAVFYEKAVRQKMAPNNVAMIAMGAVSFYQAAHDAARRGALGAELDKSWAANLAYQVQCFQAAAQYWQAIKDKAAAEETSEGFAVELARLELARQACDAAIRVVDEGGLAPSIKGTVQQLQQLVVRNLLQARHDKDMIHHEPTIQPKELPPIPPFVPAYLKALAEPSVAGDADIFQSLIPMRVNIAVSQFSERLDSLVRDVGRRVAEATQGVRETLDGVGLPGSVEAHDTVQGVPASTWERVERTQQLGGPAALVSLLGRNRECNARAGAQLAEALQLLDAETREDDAARAQYGDAWGRPGSRALSANLREDAARYQRLLAEAAQSDEQLAAQLDANATVGASLALPKAQLEAQLPRAATAAQVDTSALNATLGQLATLLRARDTAHETLGASVRGTDIKPMLLSAPGGATPDTEGVFARAAAPLEAQRDEIGRNIAAQEPLLQQALQLNSAFVAAKGADPATIERERALQSLVQAADKFDKLLSDLKSGAGFYQDLEGRVRQLGTVVRDHCEARSLQKREMALHQQSAMQGQVPTQAAQAFGVQAATDAEAAALAAAMQGASLGAPVPAPGVPAMPAAAVPPPAYPASAAGVPGYPPAAPAMPAYNVHTGAATVPHATPAPTGGAAAAGGGGSAQASANLIAMGFPPADVARALAARGGNEREAMNVLLDGK